MLPIQTEKKEQWENVVEDSGPQLRCLFIELDH